MEGRCVLSRGRKVRFVVCDLMTAIESRGAKPSSASSHGDANVSLTGGTCGWLQYIRVAVRGTRVKFARNKHTCLNCLQGPARHVECKSV